MPKRNITNHVRSPSNAARMAKSTKPAPMAKYHQANNWVRSPFPMLLFTLDAIQGCEGPLVL